MVARGFPRCKPNRIPDKRLENKMLENGKPDKMPDNLNRILTLTGSGPFMSLFTLTHTLSPSLYTLSISTQKHISIILHTLYLYLSFSLHTHSLSLSLHTPLYRCTHSLSLYFKTHSFPLSAHTSHLSLSLYPSLCTLSLSLSVHYPSLSLCTLSLSL